MKTNEGTVDRVIRVIIGILAIIGAYFWLMGTLQIVVYVIGIVAIITGATGFCGLYALLKINTCEKK